MGWSGCRLRGRRRMQLADSFSKAASSALQPHHGCSTNDSVDWAVDWAVDRADP
jgi:hypothetical protein